MAYKPSVASRSTLTKDTRPFNLPIANTHRPYLYRCFVCLLWSFPRISCCIMYTVIYLVYASFFILCKWSIKYSDSSFLYSFKAIMPFSSLFGSQFVFVVVLSRCTFRPCQPKPEWSWSIAMCFPFSQLRRIRANSVSHFHHSISQFLYLR